MSELDEFSRDIAAHVRTYLAGVHEIATGESPETAVSGLIVQLAQISMAGAMLGAVSDIVPPDRMQSMVDELKNPATFNRASGIASLSADSKGYNADNG